MTIDEALQIAADVATDHLPEDLGADELALVTLADEVERLRADVAQVRAWCDDLQVPAVHGTYQGGGYQAARSDVQRGLDGEG